MDPVTPPSILGLHHFTIRCRPDELEALRTFYAEVLGMRTGPRPAFDFPGHWLYAGDHAVVHLAGIVGENQPLAMPAGSGFDHVALHCAGLDDWRARVQRLGLPHEELPVPGWPLRQLFLHDPVGSRIELTFDAQAPAA